MEQNSLEVWKIQTQQQFEQWKVNADRSLEEWKANISWDLQHFKAVIGYSTLTIKALMLINGGAVVALLTFFGTTWKDNHSVILKILPAMNIFLLGIFLAVAVAGLSYLGQMFFARKKNKIAIPLQLFAIFFGFISLCCFGYGAVVASCGFASNP